MYYDLTHRYNKDPFLTNYPLTMVFRYIWQVFATLSKEKKGRVTIFYCGPPSLGSTISDYCVKYNFCYKHENF